MSQGIGLIGPNVTHAALMQSWAGVVAVCLLYAALCDMAVRLIPNAISVTVAALAVPFRLLHHDLASSLLVALLVFAILTLAWAARVLGGGDVKLWTACSLLLPPSWAIQGIFSLRILLIGGGVALVYFLLRLIVRLPAIRLAAQRSTVRKPRDHIWPARVWRAEQWRARRGGSIPYGVAIALSALMTFWPHPHG